MSDLIDEVANAIADIGDPKERASNLAIAIRSQGLREREACAEIATEYALACSENKTHSTMEAALINLAKEVAAHAIADRIKARKP